MAEPQETPQERETRWAAQRATRDTEQQEMRATRQRKTARTWLIVGAIVIIVAVLAVVVHDQRAVCPKADRIDPAGGSFCDPRALREPNHAPRKMPLPSKLPGALMRTEMQWRVGAERVQTHGAVRTDHIVPNKTGIAAVRKGFGIRTAVDDKALNHAKLSLAPDADSG